MDTSIVFKSFSCHALLVHRTLYSTLQLICLFAHTQRWRICFFSFRTYGLSTHSKQKKKKEQRIFDTTLLKRTFKWLLYRCALFLQVNRSHEKERRGKRRENVLVRPQYYYVLVCKPIHEHNTAEKIHDIRILVKQMSFVKQKRKQTKFLLSNAGE